MTLFGATEILDKEMRKESLILHEDQSKYAVPPTSCYDTYDEIFREYKIFGGKIFTVMIRKTKPEGKYWVRCGFKTSADSNYVGGIENRDCTTYDFDEVISHCKNHFECILNKMGW